MLYIKTIQNQIINVIADYLRNKITRDLTEGKISKYFCLIADEVTDTTTNKEVLSLCLRFLSGNDDPSSVNISEVFVDYVHLERTTDAIVKSLHDMGFDIENLRGQGYDGACCCCLPTPMTLASGGSPMFPLVVHQPASPSIWPAVQSLRRGLSTNPGATMWCVCGCS